jgi:hypothetical protein
MVGDGMVGRHNTGIRETTAGIRTVFMLGNEPKNRPPRSQSVHRSDEAG